MQSNHLFAPFLSLFIALCLTTSCSNRTNNAAQLPTSEGADTMAIACYKMQVNGLFDDYVKAMHSCDGTTDAYKERIIVMLRQHQKQINDEKQGVSNVQVLRTELHNNGRMANVFLNVNYKDGSKEEVMLPMIFDGKQWRMQ